MSELSIPTLRESSECDAKRDAQLITRFLAGDLEAFEEIVACHQANVTRLVYRLLGWPADVEDVVQDVFVTVLAKAHQFKGQARFSTWLARIAVNRCRSEQRRRWFRLKAFTGWIAWQRQHQIDRSDGCREDQVEAMRKAVRRLPLKYREAIVLHYFEEKPVREIAEAIGISVAAVEVRLHRARNKLRQALLKQS